ncbi:MAG: hypothetical protein ACRDY0_03500 [Acidimicrobiales bacterium]
MFPLLIGLHVTAALVGFGAVALSGTYGSTAADLGRPGAGEEARRWFGRPNRAAWAVFAVPGLAVAALAAAGRTAELGQMWIDAALVLWLAAAALVALVVGPAEARLRRLVGGAGPNLGATGPALEAGDPALEAGDPALARAAGRRLARAAATCDLIFVVALALMIWQPAWP